jgi:hypothetical protein
MSQLVACKDEKGIILATDSKALDFDAGGQMMDHTVQRLIQLTPYTAILSGGAAEGVKMCHTLKDFLSEERVKGIEEVYSAALPFLATEYERFMRKYCEVLPLDPLHHVYFILAGYTERETQDPFRLYLVWTKKKLPQLDGDEITSAFAIPRIMRLEYTLNRLCKENRALDDILPEIRNTLEKLPESQEEVGPPFSYAFITTEGFQTVH